MRLSDNAERVLKSRYYVKDDKGNTIEDWKILCKRVCDAVAQAEDKENGNIAKWSTAFFDIMYDLDFLPNSPTMFNAGKEKGLLSACFTLDVEDNMISIMKSLSDAAFIFKGGGGVGLSFSALRPEGELIKTTGGTASGPCSFMKMFDTMTEVIKQGGKRRGALLGLLNVDHKDINKFIASKETEGTLSNFNISVGMTDEFMYKVKAKEKDAVETWNKIIDGAYNNGEPGVLFMTTINNANPLSHMGKIKSSNPCFTGDMCLLTKDGYATFNSLNGKTVDIIVPSGDIRQSRIWKSGNKETVDVRLSNGIHIKCTPDHIFELDDGTDCKAIDLKGKKIHYTIPIEKPVIDELFLKLGYIQGDGNLGRLRDNSMKPGERNGSHLGFEINIGKKDFSIAELFNYNMGKGRKYYTTEFYDRCIELGFSDKSLPERTLPKTFNSWNRDEKLSFLQGLFSANGCVIKKNRVALKSTCKELINEVKNVLFSFTINSYITVNKEHFQEFSNGTYLCKESYDLNILKIEDLIKFKKLIGFIHSYKYKDLCSLIEDKIPYVTSVKENGLQEVFDFSEKKEYWGIVNNCVVHNCGEYLAIPYSSCNLGSINLSNMYKDGEINYDKLEKVIRIAVRFLDNVITVNWYPIPEIKDITTRTRPVGLGVMGFADLLLKLECRYDSAEAIDYAQEIMKFIEEKAYDESVKLGKEKGNFPEFKKTKLSEKYETLRNCMLTVIAPTGSLSLIAGCSSGIEPNFSWHTEMHRIDTIMEEYHPLALKFFKNNEPLPNYFVTAGEISPEWHIRMLAAFQSYVDSAISKTCNMPHTATKEDVSKAYMLAWELKTKGLTIYREGSRSKEVLVKSGKLSSKKHQKILNLIYRDRDIDLTGKTRKAKTGCGNSYITVNFDEDGYPIEVFKQVSSKGGCDAMAEGLARMTSLALRYGIDINEIIKQLRSVKCSNAISKNVGCLSCPDLMGRVLGELINKQEADRLDVKCPECDSELETSEGCIRCKTCGWSRCS